MVSFSVVRAFVQKVVPWATCNPRWVIRTFSFSSELDLMKWSQSSFLPQRANYISAGALRVSSRRNISGSTKKCTDRTRFPASSLCTSPVNQGATGYIVHWQELRFSHKGTSVRQAQLAMAPSNASASQWSTVHLQICKRQIVQDLIDACFCSNLLNKQFIISAMGKRFLLSFVNTDYANKTNTNDPGLGPTTDLFYRKTFYLFHPSGKR